MGNYMVCEWDVYDFYESKGEFYPYPKAQADNFFERNARKRYWRRKHQGKE